MKKAARCLRTKTGRKDCWSQVACALLKQLDQQAVSEFRARQTGGFAAMGGLFVESGRRGGGLVATKKVPAVGVLGGGSRKPEAAFEGSRVGRGTSRSVVGGRWAVCVVRRCQVSRNRRGRTGGRQLESLMLSLDTGGRSVTLDAPVQIRREGREKKRRVVAVWAAQTAEGQGFQQQRQREGRRRKK